MTTDFKPTVETEGEFAGWQSWAVDRYEQHTVGPFYFRKDDKGWVTAFRVAEKHLNGGNIIHGGALMSFADSALFNIAGDEMGENYFGVTVAFTSEFLSGAVLGQLMEARGDVLRAGRSLVFVRGIVTADGTPCLNFSGTIKKMPPKRPAT